MADKNQLKNTDQVDLSDDDPFAELTRIMGFDPRQPARQATPPAAQPEEPEDDFSLDLEKELLGGFSLEDEISDEEGAPVEAAAPAAETPEPEALDAEAAEVDFDFSADFEAAMAKSIEEVEAPAEQDIDLDLTEDDVRALDAEPVQPTPIEAEADFDLGLAEDDLRALGDEAYAGDEAHAPAAPAETEFAPVAAHDDDVHEIEIAADLDAAMADIDMDFLRGDAAPEPLAVTPAEAAAEANLDDAGGDADLHLFDEDDFRLEDDPVSAVEPEPEPQARPEFDESAFSLAEDDFRLEDDPVPTGESEPEPEPQPEFDESAFSLGEHELRLDEMRPLEEQAAASAADEFAFDDVDFAAEEYSAPVDVEVSMAEPDLPSRVDAAPASSGEISLPRYEPRKLPISPMDVAADEFRQREATTQAPAEPDFNLEDELNALLGNIRSNQEAAEAKAEPEFQYEPVSPSAYEPRAYEPRAYEPATASSFETTGPATGDPEIGGRSAYEPPSLPLEPVGFDPPEHPVDIEDGLNWELDDAFAAESEPVEEDQPGTYAEDERYDAYAEAGQREDVYAEGLEEDLASLDLDDLSFDPADEDAASPSTYHGEALAGAAIGAAASRFDSGFAARPFQAGASARLPDFNPHRDPVVRGDPLKEDPLDIITALAEKYSKKEPVTSYGHAMGAARGSEHFADESVADEDIDISAAFEEQPDVETVEVADRAVALADDLDIPELAEEEELPTVSAYDDLDAEFSSLLSDMNAEHRANGYDDTLAGGFNARPYESQMAAPNAQREAPQPAGNGYDDDPEPDSFALDDDYLPGSRIPSGGQYAADEYEYDPDSDQEIAGQHHMAAESRQQPRARGMLLAALVGGVALVGAIGAFALSFGTGSDGDTPTIVRADDGPVKVKPENPGGTTVPNQDNKVYETVAGEGADGAPQQEKLVTTAEEPVDVAPPPPAMEETAAAPSGKSEDRIEQILQEAENQTDAQIAAVSPRKVRTLVVKPDGTLVPREDEPAAPSNEQTETIAAAVPETVAPAESTAALPPASEPAPTPALVPAPKETSVAAPPPPLDQAAVEPEADETTMPETAPIAPLRPADQPIDVVGEVKPDQVAATATAAPAGNWAMQIASQPSEAAAQSSYQDLARRYGSVLQGRDVNIVKAEIAGKGTFWRVRVPANSRNEAIGLCESYKAAGGNCFVSR